MKTLYRILLLSMIFTSAANAAESALNIQAISAAEINNFRAPESDVLSAGQPTAEQFKIMADLGVKHVINLRTPGDGGINYDNSRSLQKLLDEFGDEGVVVHCATGNRVGALISLSVFEEGGSLDNSIQEGSRWGMTSERLQQVVRETLSEN